MPEPIRYRQKPRPVGFETAYTLDGGKLTVDSTRRVDEVDLSRVVEIRFTYEPNSLSFSGYRTKLTLADRKTLSFGNLSWRSMVDLNRQEEPYRTFTKALAAAVAVHAPQARFIAGKPLPIWLVFAAVAAMTCSVMIAFAITAMTRGAGNAALVAAFLGALAIYQIAPMVIRNRPRAIAPGEIPPDLLP